jgi:hypothetical protein
MEHNTCRENLSAYLDNELPAAEKLALESHLASCASCARELAELRKVSAVFKKHVMQPVPPALKEEVFAEKPAAPIFTGWLKPVLVLSAAACVVLILVLPKMRQQDQAYSPALFTNSYSEAQSAHSAASDQSSLDLFKERPGSRAMIGAGTPSPAQPAPRAGAFGQAKFASRGGISGGEGAGFNSGSAMYRGAASSAFSGSMAAKSGLSISAAADKKAEPQAWVDGLIRRYQAGEPGNPPYAVWQYSYKGKKVYYLPPQCCDQYGELHDEAGKLLCAPDGGISGLGDGRCADFNKLKKDGLLIWQDPRGK